jgi:hypothetical protein
MKFNTVSVTNNDLDAIKHKRTVLYTLLWQHVLTQFCHFQAINIKLVKVLYAVVLDGISN